MPNKIRVDLTADEISAVLDVVGRCISTTNERDTPLERAERILDSALMEYELMENDE